MKNQDIFSSLGIGPDEVKILAEHTVTEVTFDISPGDAKEVNVDISIRCDNHRMVREVTNIVAWLSDSPSGEGLTEAAGLFDIDSEGIQEHKIADLNGSKAALVQTLPTGMASVTIGHAQRPELYLAVLVPGMNFTAVSRKILESDYG